MNKTIALLFALSTLVACSSSTTTTTPPADTGKADGSGSDAAKDTGTTGGDTGTAKDTGKTETAPTGDDACGAMSTNNECQKCCSDNHPAAYKAFVDALLKCGCKTGNCDTACAATACASTPASPDAACTKCLNDIQSKACKPDMDACASGACADFFKCVQDQDCQSKG